MNHDNKPLGPAGINWLASRVADGTGTPDEARELISEVSQSIASWARGIVCVLAASGLQVRLLYGKLGGDGDWLELADCV